MIRAVQPVHVHGGDAAAGSVAFMWHAQRAGCPGAGCNAWIAVGRVACRRPTATTPAAVGLAATDGVFHAIAEPSRSLESFVHVMGLKAGGSTLGLTGERSELQWQPWPACPPYAFRVGRWWPWVDWPPAEPPAVVERVVELSPERIFLNTRGSMLDLWT